MSDTPTFQRIPQICKPCKGTGLKVVGSRTKGEHLIRCLICKGEGITTRIELATAANSPARHQRRTA